VIQLSTSGAEISLTDDGLASLQREFSERHCLRLPGLLSPALLTQLLSRLERAQFDEAEYDGVGRDLCMTDNTVLRALHFVVNDPVWLRTVESITGSGPLGCYLGRVYRMLPGSGHAEDWHDDISGTRRVGMSLNLSSAPFDGGEFELRYYGEEAVRLKVHNIGPGDAILFPITNTLQHRVLPVTGSAPKTAFAGWFRTEPQYWEGLQE